MSTKIEWVRNADGGKGETWNPIRGCSRVSEGCRNCFAMRMARRMDCPGGAYEGLTRMTDHGVDWSGEVRFVDDKVGDPLRWRKPRHVFVVSIGDPFHSKVSDAALDSMFGVMALADRHTYQVLTKRPQRMLEYMSHPNRPYAVAKAADCAAVDFAMDGIGHEWRTLPSCDLYEVSNWGGVRRRGRDGQSLKQSSNTGGYRQVAICSNGVPRTELVHRLVLETFHRPTIDGEESAHRNGNRADNRVANLRWATKTENMADAARHGTAGVWMKSRTKFPTADIVDIRRSRRGGEKLDSLASRYCTTKQHISAICTRKKYVSPPQEWPLPNVMLGVSCEGANVLYRLDTLRGVPALMRFVSFEPLLAPIAPDLTGIGLVIAGCESGPGARPTETDWFRSLRDRCIEAGVPYFLKQMVVDGKLTKMPELDGRVWDQLPEETR